jgi:hypothetical protein
MKRKGEQNNETCLRTDRTFEKEGNWYFNTREGRVVGPFRDELEVTTQLEIYIRKADSGLLVPGDDYSISPAMVEGAVQA